MPDWSVGIGRRFLLAGGAGRRREVCCGVVLQRYASVTAGADTDGEQSMAGKNYCGVSADEQAMAEWKEVGGGWGGVFICRGRIQLECW
jgi:hypothetical protein